MATRTHSVRGLLMLVIIVLLLGNVHGANAQNNTNNSNTNTNANTTGNANSNANSTGNANANTNTSQNRNANTNSGNANQAGTEQTPGPTPSPDARSEARRDTLSASYWFPVIISVMFGLVLIPFAWTIMRAIRFSKSTFNSPLGLPEGSLRAMLAFTLVAFLGFYVLASILSMSELKPPDFLLGIVATVIGFYFGSRSAEERTATARGSVEGSVVDKNGSPAPGANVELSQSGVKKFTQNSDVNGKYRFENVPVGNYDIQATLTGQNPSDVGKVSVTAGATQTSNLKLK